MEPDADPSSLRSLQRHYLLQQLRQACRDPGLYSLILDAKTEAVILRVISKNELLRIVATVEKLSDRRRTQSYMSAVYLVEPSVFNLNCILADVHTRRYKAGIGRFVPFSQWDEQGSRFFHSRQFLQNPDVARFFAGGENIAFVHCSMYGLESRVFLSETPRNNAKSNSMPVYYNENCSELVLPQVRRAARAIVDAVVVAQEYPLIRFFASPEAAHAAQRLPELIADEVQRQLDDYARANPAYPPEYAPEKPRAVLLVCDRTIDLFSPLLHEFSYQAMAMDVVEGLERRGVYSYAAEAETGEKQTIETRLDSEDSDSTWRALRHTHIIEASELVLAKISALIKNNPLMVDRQKATTASDLMYVVAHLQGFDEERREATLHKTLVDECLEINATRKLAELAADFEQTCAAQGTSFEGVRHKHLHDELVRLLSRADLHVNDKMRLVLVYSLYRGGLAESDFVKLARFIGVRDSQIVSLVSRCFHNLRKLGWPIVKASVSEKHVARQTFHTITNDGTYNTSRFSPGIKRVLVNATRGDLDEDWFPYFRDKPLQSEPDPSSSKTSKSSLNGTGSGSLRNARIKASWAPPASRASGSSVRKGLRHRVFCYVAGGITYSEMRSVYELSSSFDKDFFLGSECVLNPRDFLIGLQNIDSAKGVGELDLSLSSDLALAVSAAPDHLFEKPKAPAPVTASGSAPGIGNMGQTAGPANPAQSGFNPPLPESNVPANTPSHYQKRGSQPVDTTEPKKEKKSSRLKKFFK